VTPTERGAEKYPQKSLKSLLNPRFFYPELVEGRPGVPAAY